MSSPLVSIIIPTYNRLYALAELLESLRRQTYQNFEIIIINDFGQLVDNIISLYPELKITVINLLENRKHVYARNQGVLKARGEYVMLIDDDDILLPKHLEQMVGEIEGVDLVYSDVEIVNYEWENKMRVPKSRYLFAYKLDLEGMRKFSTFVPSGCLYKKEIHNQIGFFDETLMNYWDWDFFLSVSNSFKVKRVPVASVLYEFSDTGSNQSKNLSSMRKYLDKLAEKHDLGYLPTKNFFLLLEEAEVKNRQASSHVVWDGLPIHSRFIQDRGEG
ncbi:glycosyltransferase family 2 protein [Aquibacillus rhizosphaerae]|uniref:Glycosyltransferase family 2 protein n=1 Tax=Aquibacillus rhizosphaerae TaxID=3051431 RepID=A0ABT7L599_9BACI|nr:glycosyltransferase family 2 protein [Aquibacillus sp. LR5S19]MDL4841043.1 glycosyltransferase family 2 protein [Aquibacillus sp. LR5S19]